MSGNLDEWVQQLHDIEHVIRQLVEELLQDTREPSACTARAITLLHADVAAFQMRLHIERGRQNQAPEMTQPVQHEPQQVLHDRWAQRSRLARGQQ